MILPIALLALSSLKQAATVSFTCRAEPLSRLMVDLSKATGLKLTATKECANDVLLISVKNVTADQLLAEIAKVDAGQWEKNGENLRFSANAAARHAEARAEMARQAKIVKAAIQKEKSNVLKRETQAGQQAEGSANATLRGLSESDAMSVKPVVTGAAMEEAIISLLENLDPDVLVLRREQRIVLSTHPTGMQLQLEAGADLAIGQMVERRNAAAKILEATAADRAKRSASGDSAQGPTVRPISGYSKADLAVADGGTPGILHVQLTLYAADGGTVLKSRFFEIGRDLSDDGEPATATKIEISEAAKAFRTMHNSQTVGDSALVAIPPAIVPYLTDLEHNDPLALSPSDEILFLAQSQNKPLVAVIPDSAFNDTLPVSADTTLERFSHSLAEGETMTIESAGDWIEIKPSYPASARQYRCDRAALGSFLRSCMKESIPSMDEFAEFTTKADLANNDVVSAYLEAAVSGYGNAGLSTELTWNLYRIYSEFSPDQRATLIAGGKLPLSVLSSSQLANFTQFAYGALQRLRYGTGPAPLSASFPSARQIGSDQPRTAERGGLPPAKGYESEPTELLPNGVQANGYIEMKVVEEPFVSPFGPTTAAQVLPRVMGVAQMAKRQADAGEPDFGKDGAIKFEKFKLGSRKLHQLTIHASDRAFVTGRLYDFHLYQDSPVFAMGSLPSDWQSELSKRLAALKEEQAAEDRKSAPPPR